ncbi:MAG: MotA/TolQ/ExbB proton channel family protein [Pleurocapsa sp. SU_5_0]|nr:MotA/TolQ/ExbB proton channel family protein [Pleurocapsa sp. SU_5_0]NJO97067.1 MotA/TolQ/ExbB proton channel family protein [Pleurocapsa sp. CRU_1_2]NJR46986.1 MotA/TolQ/ExbB proton channel family protein [Hyellaceae cyanobacterium CSU_1_1]
MNFLEIIDKGGISMYPLLFLSVLSIATILERLWFWSRVVFQEKKIFNQIMEAAERNWNLVGKIAQEHINHPLGNFVYSPFRLSNPDPDMFHLALESAAEEQVARMRKGDKVLEAIIALSPLLGLFGTVWGLIQALSSIKISDLGTADSSGVTLGIGESLISTATGLLVAIISLSFYRMFQAFWANQVRILRRTGSRLEVMYRDRWSQLESEELESEPTTIVSNDQYSFVDIKPPKQ